MALTREDVRRKQPKFRTVEDYLGWLLRHETSLTSNTSRQELTRRKLLKTIIGSLMMFAYDSCPEFQAHIDMWEDWSMKQALDQVLRKVSGEEYTLRFFLKLQGPQGVLEMYKPEDSKADLSCTETMLRLNRSLTKEERHQLRTAMKPCLIKGGQLSPRKILLWLYPVIQKYFTLLDGKEVLNYRVHTVVSDTKEAAKVLLICNPKNTKLNKRQSEEAKSVLKTDEDPPIKNITNNEDNSATSENISPFDDSSGKNLDSMKKDNGENQNNDDGDVGSVSSRLSGEQAVSNDDDKESQQIETLSESNVAHNLETSEEDNGSQQLGTSDKANGPKSDQFSDTYQKRQSLDSVSISQMENHVNGSKEKVATDEATALWETDMGTDSEESEDDYYNNGMDDNLSGFMVTADGIFYNVNQSTEKSSTSLNSEVTDNDEVNGKEPGDSAKSMQYNNSDADGEHIVSADQNGVMDDGEINNSEDKAIKSAEDASRQASSPDPVILLADEVEENKHQDNGVNTPKKVQFHETVTQHNKVTEQKPKKTSFKQRGSSTLRIWINLEVATEVSCWPARFQLHHPLPKVAPYAKYGQELVKHVTEAMDDHKLSIIVYTGIGKPCPLADTQDASPPKSIRERRQAKPPYIRTWKTDMSNIENYLLQGSLSCNDTLNTYCGGAMRLYSVISNKGKKVLPQLDENIRNTLLLHLIKKKTGSIITEKEWFIALVDQLLKVMKSGFCPSFSQANVNIWPHGKVTGIKLARVEAFRENLTDVDGVQMLKYAVGIYGLKQNQIITKTVEF